MTIKWGDPIECNGVRPDWLRDDDTIRFENTPDTWLTNRADFFGWAAAQGRYDHCPLSIQLPADHPAYVALARGFQPWIGGERAPDDWDATQPVLFRNGEELVSGKFNWAIPLLPSIGETGADIIGYRKRVEYGAVHTDGSRSGGQSLAPDPVRIAPMTLDEWKTIQFHPGTTAWAQSVGLIRPETLAERFTRETGHAVTEAVEAALNWKDTGAGATSDALDSHQRVSDALATLRARVDRALAAETPGAAPAAKRLCRILRGEE